MHSFEPQQLLPQGYSNASPHARTVTISKCVEDSLSFLSSVPSQEKTDGTGPHILS